MSAPDEQDHDGVWLVVGQLYPLRECHLGAGSTLLDARLIAAAEWDDHPETMITILPLYLDAPGCSTDELAHIERWQGSSMSAETAGWLLPGTKGYMVYGQGEDSAPVLPPPTE